MINMLKLGFVPRCCEWVFSGGAGTPTVAWYRHTHAHTRTCMHTHALACVAVLCVVCAAVWRRGRQRSTSTMGGAVGRSWPTWTACTALQSSSCKWVVHSPPGPHSGWTPPPPPPVQYNPCFDVVISADESGMLEYWGGPAHAYAFPSHLDFQYKTDTDLYEFAKSKSRPTCLAFSADGRMFVTLATDRKVRVHC